MESLKINENLQAVCEWKKTRVAFKHVATLLRDGREIAETKICYLNRTWERYTYESVLQKLLGKVERELSDGEQKAFKLAIANGGEHDKRGLRAVAMVASL